MFAYSRPHDRPTYRRHASARHIPKTAANKGNSSAGGVARGECPVESAAADRRAVPAGNIFIAPGDGREICGIIISARAHESFVAAGDIICSTRHGRDIAVGLILITPPPTKPDVAGRPFDIIDRAASASWESLPRRRWRQNWPARRQSRLDSPRRRVRLQPKGPCRTTDST